VEVIFTKFSNRFPHVCKALPHREWSQSFFQEEIFGYWVHWVCRVTWVC